MADAMGSCARLAVEVTAGRVPVFAATGAPLAAEQADRIAADGVPPPYLVRAPEIVAAPLHHGPEPVA